MSTFISILWQEYVLFKRKFFTITLAAMVSPILYLIAFGWGVGKGLTIEGQTYINFVIPGIIALTTMTVSFSNTSSSINISRIFYKTFEAFMIAPITVEAYSLGKIVAGALMGMYSAFLIIVLSLIFNTGLHINMYFIIIVMLNCLVFSAIGFTAGIFIKSHKDMGKFSSFIITPMSFLCGTFFPLEKMPTIIRDIIWLLPLTHTSLALRSNGENLKDMIIHVVILLIYFFLIFAIGSKKCKTAE